MVVTPVNPHPNDMTQWPEIRCQEGHDRHASRPVRVDLSVDHGYHDLPAVPRRFWRSYEFWIYDHRAYRKATRYCPGHDAVSETIDSHGIWEPAETILTLSACAGARDPLGVVLDLGCQIGWFSALALSAGHPVLAMDAEIENLRTFQRTIDANGWGERVDLTHERVGPDTPRQAFVPHPIVLVKLDLEGAERDALRVIWPQIAAGLVDHLLVEISPVFADYYPDLLDDLLDLGYRCWQVPEKNPQERPTLDELPNDLGTQLLAEHGGREQLRAWVAAQHQFNAWLSLPGARFG